MSEASVKVVAAYSGSNGELTRALFAELEALGPAGILARDLFRAQKASERAKVYRRGYRGVAYDKKQWAMGLVCATLCEHADKLDIRFGWGIDAEQEFHSHVLYVDLPTGQVSFHTSSRGDGPDYPGEWDGMPGRSADRVCRWCVLLLDPEGASVDDPAAAESSHDKAEVSAPRRGGETVPERRC